ncbi:mPR-typeG-protein-coupled receptor [Lasiosphaeria ovina]|uniref:MPR-typeG-protein-coupled receptor n=1 Tax=Lasiosphaeria ovina TaxID=92902 RepID=A0AAE0JT34_9PEZI|nr:mPR-typeG-protein-coupled receptor [Lasiosphaeria ovina]
MSPTEAKKLLLYSEIPAWQQENEYVLSGYRPTSGSFAGSVRSLCRLHNETVNIWSHLLGCLLFLSLPVYLCRWHIYQRHPTTAGLVDVAVISVYAVGVAVCFALSAAAHAVWNHSIPVAHFSKKLDYLGILVLMWSAGIPTIYYGFSCNPELQVLYWLTTSISALGCAVFTFDPRFRQPRFRRWRAALYAGFGFSSLLFVGHGLLLHGWALQKARMSLVWMAWMTLFNLVGVVAYVSRMPERWFPYRFDLFCSSHQIFHVAVMVAGLAHFAGLLDALDVSLLQLAPCVAVRVIADSPRSGLV